MCFPVLILFLIVSMAQSQTLVTIILFISILLKSAKPVLCKKIKKNPKNKIKRVSRLLLCPNVNPYNLKWSYI